MTVVVVFSHKGENKINNEIRWLEKGNTMKVAETIIQELGGDKIPLIELIPTRPYPETYYDCNEQSRSEAEREILPDNFPYWEKVDNMFLCFPIWHRDMPGPVVTFVKELNKKGFCGTIIPVCTNDEGSFGVAELTLRSLVPAGCYIKAGVSIHGLDVIEDNYQDKIKRITKNM